MKTQLLALTVLSLLSGVANAQADESRCRSWLSPYSAPAWDCGTSTGLAGDYVIVRNCYGQVVFCETVAWCCSHIGAYNGFIRGVEFHSGGQISVRLYFPGLGNVPALTGGVYEVRRNGFVIDRDALV